MESCKDCVTKPKMNCLNCEMERACKTRLDRISQKKTYSTDINMLKRKPANEYCQMLPYFIGEYETKLNNFDFESAKEILTTAERPMIEKRHIEWIKEMITCKSYIKNEDIPENEEVFVYGFQHIKTDKAKNNILFGFKSDFWCRNL